MAAPRVADTGAEIRPVELWLPNTTGSQHFRLNYDGAPGLFDGRTADAFTGIWAQVSPHVFNGVTWDRVRRPVVFKTIAGVAVVAGTPQTIWTPGVGKKWRLMAYHLGVTAACAVIFKYGAANTEALRTGLMAANTGVASPDMGQGLMLGAADEALKIDVTANATVHGWVAGLEE
jgi:hypothetical protein